MYSGFAFKRQELTRLSIGQTKLCGKKISLRFSGFLGRCSRGVGGEGEGHEWGKGLRSTRANYLGIRSLLPSYASTGPRRCIRTRERHPEPVIVGQPPVTQWETL
jgi:hypothetical protein